MRVMWRERWRLALVSCLPVLVLCLVIGWFQHRSDASVRRAHAAPVTQAKVDQVREVALENSDNYTVYDLTVSDPAHDTHFHSRIKDEVHRADPALRGMTVPVRVDPQDRGTAVWADDPDYRPPDDASFTLAFGGVFTAVLLVVILVVPAAKPGRAPTTKS